MQNLKNEKFKKILIISVFLALFGVSYYYYFVDKKPATKVIKTPAKTTATATKTTKKPPKVAKKPAKIKPKVEPKAKKETKKVTNNKIKPTNIKDIIANAMESSGKSDPFTGRKGGGPFSSVSNIPGIGSLPTPPMGDDYNERKPAEAVVIKGFLGDKVIAEVKGITEALGVNQTLKGVKVLKVDHESLSCDFEIDGEKTTKTMQPLTEQNLSLIKKHL